MQRICHSMSLLLFKVNSRVILKYVWLQNICYLFMYVSAYTYKVIQSSSEKIESVFPNLKT